MIRSIENNAPAHLSPVLLIRPRSVLLGYFLGVRKGEYDIVFYTTSGLPYVDSLPEGGVLIKTLFTIDEFSKLEGADLYNLLSLFEICKSCDRALYKALSKQQVIAPYKEYAKEVLT